METMLLSNEVVDQALLEGLLQRWDVAYIVEVSNSQIVGPLRVYSDLFEEVYQDSSFRVLAYKSAADQLPPQEGDFR